MHRIISYILLLLVISGTYYCSSSGNRHENLQATDNVLIFDERYPDNVGEIQTVILKLNRWSWNTSLERENELTPTTHYQLNGEVPEGLSFHAKVLSRNELALSFSGQAVNHHVNDSIDHLELVLLQPVFLNESPKALQEEITTYEVHIQFGVGYALSGHFTGENDITIEVKSSGESFELDQSQNTFSTETLFEPGDFYEVRVQQHPQSTCCSISSNGRGQMGDHDIQGIEIQCSTPTWSTPTSFQDFLGSEFNPWAGENELITTSSNHFGEVNIVSKQDTENSHLIFDHLSAYQSSISPTLTNTSFRNNTIPSNAQNIISHTSNKGLQFYMWTEQDQNGDDQIHGAAINRDVGIVDSGSISNGSEDKSHFTLVAHDTQAYFIWVNNQTEIRFAYFDGSGFHASQQLWIQGQTIDQLKATINDQKTLFAAWSTNAATQKLYVTQINDNQIVQPTPNINEALSFEETSVDLFDIASTKSTQKVIWSQQDPILGNQYNMYEASVSNQTWQKPESDMDYFRSEPNAIQTLDILSNHTTLSLIWGYASGQNYLLRWMDRENHTWENFLTFAQIDDSDAPHIQASMNMNHDVLVTWAQGNSGHIYRKTRINQIWQDTSTVNSMNLDNEYFSQHQSRIADNRTMHIAWEAKEDNKYRLYKTYKLANSAWYDPGINDYINPPASYYSSSGNHFQLATSNGCGAGQIIWTQNSEDMQGDTFNGKQVFQAIFE